jgi:hypothetical protein
MIATPAIGYRIVISASAEKQPVILSEAGKHGRSRRTSNIPWVLARSPKRAEDITSIERH